MNDIATPAIAEQAPTAMPPSAAPHHVFLIDGSGFIFRAYFARTKDPTVQRFQTKSGLQTEVVMIFSNMLDKYLRETDADHIAVIFDASGRSFRNEMYGEYKATAARCRRISPRSCNMCAGRPMRSASARSRWRISRPTI